MRYLKLNDGAQMAQLGYGTYKIEENATDCVLNALEVGYRHIDTATLYRNDDQVGVALRQCGIPRDQIFVTEKLWTNVRTADDVKCAVETMLRNLQTDYIDLLLIHWPTPDSLCVWREMENLHRQKVAKSIGVSNFLPHHLDEIVSNSEIVPSVNQVELHPFFQQKDLRAYCDKLGIVVEAWSPLMRGNALDNGQLQTIADNHGKTTAQVILRYDIQLGISVLPKTTKKERMKENFDVFDFELSPEEMAAIAALDQNHRRYRDPDNHGF